MIYFDNAATSRFKPIRSVFTELKFAVRSANPGRGSHKDAIDAALAVEEARTVLSEHFMGMRVIFTKNCTEAICTAIRGLKFKGEAVCSPLEHNAVLRTLEREARNGLKTVISQPDENGEVTASTIEKSLNATTKIVILSKMSNVTGKIVDEISIGKLLKARRILFMLDVAQSEGHLPIDTKYVDIIVSSGHKGLHGPAGTGFLAYKEYVHFEPLLTGGTGTSSLSVRHPSNFPDGFEAGTQSAANISALGKAAFWTYQNKTKINTKIEKLSLLLYDGLQKLDGVILLSRRGAPLVTFNIKSKSGNDVATLLSEHFNIAVRAGLHCAPLAHKFLGTEKTGAVRASVGMNNSLTDVKKLLKAIRSML